MAMPRTLIAPQRLPDLDIAIAREQSDEATIAIVKDMVDEAKLSSSGNPLTSRAS
jgi:hypothetical protein